MRNGWMAVLAALLLLTAVHCGGREDPAHRGASAPKLTIGHVGHDHQIALFVAALDPERFKARCDVWLEEKKPREVYDLIEGGKVVAELHLIKVGGGSKMPAAMEKGDIDVGLGGIPSVMFFVDKGNDFKIISPLNVDGDMLLLKPEFPADDWAGFVKAVKASERPVRIGYKAPVAVAKLVFEGALDSEGIPYGDAAPPGGRYAGGPPRRQQDRSEPGKGHRRWGRNQRTVREPRGSQEGGKDRLPPGRSAAGGEVEGAPLLLHLRHAGHDRPPPV